MQAVNDRILQPATLCLAPAIELRERGQEIILKERKKWRDVVSILDK